MEFTTHFELQSQATRLVESVSYVATSRAQTGFSPSMMPCSKRLLPGGSLTTASIDYNSVQRGYTDFQVELFPLHSPLLGESWLVSFPPLSYMLKFSGSSCLI